MSIFMNRLKHSFFVSENMEFFFFVNIEEWKTEKLFCSYKLFRGI